MYIGHVGIALGLRRARSAPPLWLLVVAAQLPDWGDSVLDLAGVRVSVPGWGPHGWPMVALGALGVGVVGARLARTWRGGVLAAVACVSHWCVDYITGFKPTWPGGPFNVGLGWYGHAPRDFVLESIVAFAGILLWRGSLPRPDDVVLARARPRRNAGLDWGLFAVLVVMQFGVNVAIARHVIP